MQLMNLILNITACLSGVQHYQYITKYQQNDKLILVFQKVQLSMSLNKTELRLNMEFKQFKL